MANARNFGDLLQARWDEGKSGCVGLDSDVKKLPARLTSRLSPCDAQLAFNQEVVDATKDLVCAYKPNLSFYRGGDGKCVLQDTIAYINEVAPGVPVILDSKRGDIGNSNDGYVEEDFDWLIADAVTVHPYLGSAAMMSFLTNPNKGVFALCKTSNEGSSQFQDVQVQPWFDEDLGKYFATWEDAEAAGGRGEGTTVHGMPMYEYVAHTVKDFWNEEDRTNCGLVVGATYPEVLGKVRKIVGNKMPILIPGYGAQGGELEAAVAAGKNNRRQGMIINSSRGIIFAPDPRTATVQMQGDITAALAA